MIITNLTDVDYWFGPMHLPGGSGQTLNLDDTTDTSLYLLNDEVADAVNTLYLSSNIMVTSYATPFPRPTGVPSLLHGDGHPEGMVYAPQGSLYMRRDSTAASTGLYTKTTGVTQNTGWFSVIAPAMELLKEIPVEADTATISFDSIPQTFSHLKIIANLAQSGTDTEATLQMTVNGSTSESAAYCSQVTISNDADVTTAQYSLVSAAYVGLVPQPAYTSGTEITLMGYTNGSSVGFTAMSGSNGAYALSTAYSGGILLTAELGGTGVESIQLSLEDGSDFVEGGVATLYGLAGNASY